MEYLSYDPNFTDNMEEDTDDENHEEEEDEYVFSFVPLRCFTFNWCMKDWLFISCALLFYSESANEYTDDEDVSWKVRRAAAKCLAALIVSRPEMLCKLYEEVYICLFYYELLRDRKSVV